MVAVEEEGGISYSVQKGRENCPGVKMTGGKCPEGTCPGGM